jgi:heptosyltransferase-2
MAPPVAKTLIIRFSSVGDIILSSPLIRALRRRFPEAEIDFLVKSQYADLVRGNPHLTRVLEFPSGGSFGQLRELRRRVRETGYDLIVDIHGNLRSRYIAYGARRIARYRKHTLHRRALVHLKWNLFSETDRQTSVALRYLAPLAPFGVTDDGLGLEVFPGEEDRARALTLLREAGLEGVTPLVAVAAGARHWNKRWPAERFAHAAALIAQKRGGAVLLLGAEDDGEVCRSVLDHLSRIAPALRAANLAGRMSLRQAAALMDRCALVLTNDSGLMHLAAARKRPLVALFGPTVREFGFFPFGTESVVLEHAGLECRPCTTIGRADCPRSHFRCMLDTAPEAVARSAEQVLAA